MKRPEESRAEYGSDREVRPRPRIIRSDTVRYPGVDPVENARQTGPPTGRLQPMRDTGLRLEPRTMRVRRRRQQTKRARTILAAVTIGVLLVAIAIWRATAPPRASEAAAGKGTPGVTIAEAVRPAQPTPLIATYGKLKLRLPVGMGSLTELGYHQASYSYALHLKSLLPAADMSDAKRDRGTGRDLSGQEDGPDAILTGSVLKMWRGPNDVPDSAIDVGAAPGSPVLAAVTGTVVLVKPYKLYGKHDDIRIHIQPDGRPDLDLVLIHVQNPKVKAGDRVEAGVTQVGEIRKLSDKVKLQLRTYVKDEGNHVHVQLNNAEHPDYKGLEGAISVSGS